MTGRGVRVAVIDSGVYADHPHVNGVAGGVGIDADGREHADFVDRLGHGTAVAAAIRDQAPDVDLFAVRIFDRQLSAGIGALVAAIEWSARAGMDVVNLSLGSPKIEHEAVLRRAVETAAAHRTIVVAARDDEGVRYFPGSLQGVIPVQVDWTLPRREYRVVEVEGQPVIRASGLPREIPGVPPSRNLHGVSFAVANASGILARALEGVDVRSVDAVISLLDEARHGGHRGAPKTP
jgi:subtilisin family serine protease